MKKVMDLGGISSGYSSSTSTSTSTSSTATTTSTVPPSIETGTHDFSEKKYVEYPFGKYTIVVELTSDDKFIGITQVQLNKDFRSLSQKLSRKIEHDVEEYYKDE
jgi:hypothetical protein